MKLSPKVKYEIHSAVNTVVSAVIVELGVQVFTHHELLDPTMMTKGLVVGVALSLVRAAWKAGIIYLMGKFGIKPPKPV